MKTFTHIARLPPMVVLAGHAIGWALFITLEVVILYSVTGMFQSFGRYVFYYALNVGLFYFCTNTAFPSAMGRRLPFYVLLPAWVAGTACVYILLSAAGNYLFFNRQGHGIGASQVIFSVYRLFYFVMLAAAYFFPLHFLQKKEEAKTERLALEKKLMRSQNAYLQSRLKPHLLFNSLNFLQDITYGSREASLCILLLSDILRYSLEEPDDDGTVLLVSEIRQIRNYIDLHQLRTRRPLNIHASVSQTRADTRIIPLLLLSLVENIFHHGSLGENDPKATLLITCENDVLEFYSRNAIRRGQTPGNGFGIANNLVRLESRYPGKYQFSKKTEHNEFIVQLSIQLN